MEEHHDKNKTGLDDAKEERYMNPDRDPHRYKDPLFDPHRQAGLTHGFGVFLILLGAWLILEDLNLLPDISIGGVLAVGLGLWLLKRHKR